MNQHHSSIHNADPGTQIMQNLQRSGFKQTPQRRIILEVFLEMKGHPSTEEIHAEIIRRGYKTGLATIYRTFRALMDTGIVRRLEFGDGQGRYERHDDREQHIHLVCKQCGRTFEAPADNVETLFEELAENRAFALHSHTTYLHGVCNSCLSKSPVGKTNKPLKGDTSE